MHTMDATNGGVLQAIEGILGKLYLPALRANTVTWGELSKSAKGGQLKNEFLNNVESFVSVLAGARESIEEKVTLAVSHSLFWLGGFAVKLTAMISIEEHPLLHSPRQRSIFWLKVDSKFSLAAKDCKNMSNNKTNNIL